MPKLNHQVIGIKTIFITETAAADNYCDKVLALFAIARDKLSKSGIELDDNLNFGVVFTGDFLLVLEVIRKLQENLSIHFPNHVILWDWDLEERNVEQSTMITRSLAIHSVEWPLVIHICIASEEFREDNILQSSCEKYLARSRATTALVDILLNIESTSEPA